jgi:mono/diheme cytochrome c family protein
VTYISQEVKMKKVLKWIGILLGALVVLLVAAALVLSFAGASRLNKTRDVTAERITVAADDAALARGEHLVDVACRDCHGADLSGQPIIDEGPIGTIYAANISGVAETHSDADLVRAIRHGVDTDGRQLIIMPSTSFVHFSEEDLGAIIAYLKTVPRAGEDRPAPRLGPLGRILMGSGMFGDVFSAEQIEHDAPFHEMPEVGANAAYGEYVSRLASLATTSCAAYGCTCNRAPWQEQPRISEWEIER